MLTIEYGLHMIYDKNLSRTQVMKKLLFSFFLCLMSISAFCQHPQVIHGTLIEWQVRYGHPITGPLTPKSPVQVPEASIDGHTLYLYDVDYDLTLSLLDEDSEEVYTVFIPANTTSVVLPSTLTGEFELQLFTDGIYYFVGTIEL